MPSKPRQMGKPDLPFAGADTWGQCTGIPVIWSWFAAWPRWVLETCLPSGVCVTSGMFCVPRASGTPCCPESWGVPTPGGSGGSSLKALCHTPWVLTQGSCNPRPRGQPPPHPQTHTGLRLPGHWGRNGRDCARLSLPVPPGLELPVLAPKLTWFHPILTIRDSDLLPIHNSHHSPGSGLFPLLISFTQKCSHSPVLLNIPQGLATPWDEISP